MLKYAKIIDKKTHACEVGIGTNTNYYKSIGMKELDVEQDCNGSWYLFGYLPNQDIEILKENKISELKDNCNKYILSVYPYYKQMNIINPLSDYTIDDRIKMNEFIDLQRSICSSKKLEINQAYEENDIEKLKNINIDFGE